MRITIKLAKALTQFTNNNKTIDYDLGDERDLDLGSLLVLLDKEYHGLRQAVSKDGLEIIDSINIYVNGDNVRYMAGLRTAIHDGDQINIIPAAAAG